MTKKFCKQCGNALTKAGAKFCTTCGATVDGAEIGDLSDQETKGLPGEQSDQTAFATEVIPAITPPSYETEEMPRMIITARVEERATEVIEAIAPTTAAKSSKKQTEPAQEKQPSAQQPGGNPGGRKKLALAAAIGVVVGLALVAVAFLIVNSRRGSEAQAGTQPVDKVEPSTSPQPIAPQANQQASQEPSPPSGVDANNQAQSQTRPQPGSSIGEVKSPAVRNNESASNPQQQAAAKPTPTPPQEKQAAGGTSAAEHKAQGINYLSSGRYQEALQEFEYVKKLDPGDKDVYYLFGSTYLKMNQLERALEAYRQCTSGPYVSPSQYQVKNLEKKVGKVNAK
ncbi:MAG TPA: tetratricopeptide repeat protein [Blastocatellia bacterium]|nr:tetratricopeptide repeat protein [Blastocatellia bacterium]